MSKSWLHKARILGRDPNKQNFPMLEGHPAAQEHAKVAIETHRDIQNRVKKLYKDIHNL